MLSLYCLFVLDIVNEKSDDVAQFGTAPPLVDVTTNIAAAQVQEQLSHGDWPCEIVFWEFQFVISIKLNCYFLLSKSEIIMLHIILSVFAEKVVLSYFMDSWTVNQVGVV